MADKQILFHLKELQKDSGKRISESLIIHMTYSFTRYQLFKTIRDPKGYGYLRVPIFGVDSLKNKTQAVRKIKTLPAASTDSFTYRLNTSLLGGESYPILEVVLGTIAGAVSAGAGLLFTVASTGLNLARTSQRVLGRAGDEIWQVEEIGKTGSDVIHVGSYFLVDPYRSKGDSNVKGWLIHEERNELDI